MRAAQGEVIAGPRLDLCLDFANTLAWRGRARGQQILQSGPQEQLHDFAELLAWCVGADCVSERAAERMRAWSHKHPQDARAALDDALGLREAIYRIVSRDGRKDQPANDDLARLNRALGAGPPRTALGHAGDRVGWRVARKGITAAAILAPVLWSAADLLVGQQLERVRQCANSECLWLFIDERKGGKRRWCSMQACGNRAKARRHYLRRKR